MTVPPLQYALSASYGNDSIALIQWAAERGLAGVTVVFSDTGWASRDRMTRVERAEAWCGGIGFKTHRIQSEGLPDLVRRKRAWPRQGMQFCTSELKILPMRRWLDEVDPLELATALVGVRREESFNRRNFPEWESNCPSFGGRARWAPLVQHSKRDRDDLLVRAGFAPLPHRSKECFPCINANKSDLVALEADKDRIDEIEALETEMGFTSKGKPRVMYRPYRHRGAVGIRSVLSWAASRREDFALDDGTGGGNCDEGVCAL